MNIVPGRIENDGGEIGLLYRASRGDGSPGMIGCLPVGGMDGAADTTVGEGDRPWPSGSE